MPTILNFLASARHAEYTLQGPGVTVTDVWDYECLEQFDSQQDEGVDEVTADMWTQATGLPETLFSTEWDLMWENIVRIEGDADAVAAALDTLIADLSNTPGGDDDTFDYWPSGVIYAQDIAAALASVGRNGYDEKIEAAVYAAIYGTGFEDELYDKVGLTPPERKSAANGSKVWVVVTVDRTNVDAGRPLLNRVGRQSDLEVLSAPPTWDLAAQGQVCFEANVNGGDSRPYVPETPAVPLHEV